MECWRFYDSQHKNAHISDRSPSRQLKKSCLEKSKQKPTNCNYPKQMEKSQLQLRCSFVMRKEENVRKIYEKCLYYILFIWFCCCFCCVWKNCMLSLKLIRKFMLAHAEFQHCSTCLWFFFVALSVDCRC